MLQDTALIEYDEKHDAYSPITAVPEDTTITEIPPGDYGEAVADEDVYLSIPLEGGIQPKQLGGFAITGNRIYTLESYGHQFRTDYIVYWDREGNRLSDRVSAGSRPSGPNHLVRYRTTAYSFTVYDAKFYIVRYRQDRDNQSTRDEIYIVDIATRSTVATYAISGSTQRHRYIAVTPTRIIIAPSAGSTIRFFDHAGNEMTNENFTAGFTIIGIAATSDYIFLLDNSTKNIRVFRHNGTELSHLSITTGLTGIWRLAVTDRRIHVLQAPRTSTERPSQITMYSFSTAQALAYHGFVPFQFDTDDFDSILFLGNKHLARRYYKRHHFQP